jgi:hypothetical protein
LSGKNRLPLNLDSISGKINVLIFGIICLYLGVPCVLRHLVVFSGTHGPCIWLCSLA